MIVENYEKLFTKKESNNIIKEDYNPLKVNYKLIYKREGICMESETLKVLKKLNKKYNKREILLLEMIKKSEMFGYNIKETEKLIEEFYLFKDDLFVTLLWPTSKILSNLKKFLKVVIKAINQRKIDIILNTKNL